MSETTQTTPATAAPPQSRNAGYYEFGYGVFMILLFAYVIFLHRRLSKLEKEKQS